MPRASDPRRWLTCPQVRDRQLLLHPWVGRLPSALQLKTGPDGRGLNPASLARRFLRSVDVDRKLSPSLCALLRPRLSAEQRDVRRRRAGWAVPDHQPGRAPGAHSHGRDGVRPGPGVSTTPTARATPIPARPMERPRGRALRRDHAGRRDGVITSPTQNISYNLAVLQSLQFLLSTVSNIRTRSRTRSRSSRTRSTSTHSTARSAGRRSLCVPDRRLQPGPR